MQILNQEVVIAMFTDSWTVLVKDSLGQHSMRCGSRCLYSWG